MDSKFKIFVSGNQREFKVERIAIKELIKEDPFYNNIFDVFIFEDTSATGESPENVYLNEVRKSDVFIGLFGDNYGEIKRDGMSATEIEYREFTKGPNSINTFILVKKTENIDDKSREFINSLDNTYSRFENLNELKRELRDSLFKFATQKNIISSKGFDDRVEMLSSYDDVDEEKVKEFLRKSNITYNVGNIEEDIENTLLNRLKVLKKVDNKLKLTNTGILLFSKEPKKFIPQNEIRVLRFKGNTKTEIIDRLYINSTIFDLLDKVETFFKRNTRTAIKIEGFRRYNIPEYPYTAIREAIVNAISHRDYDIFGTVITINIFYDRVEIINPGKLMPPLTIDDLGEMPVHRNPHICDLLEKTDTMEKAGSGIPRMRESMENYGLTQPEFSEKGDFFKVVFNGPKENIMDLTPENEEEVINLDEKFGLNKRQISALKIMIESKNTMTVKKYGEHFGVSRSTATRDLKKLLDLDLISKDKIKGKKETIYVIV
ncbi:MAG: DUF4062 domain-containing protein [Methanobrevibacter sp.]|jgi:predicted HTH transcriptional regulator|nr:DUF4062 domain-containing protein [Candidatus Methanoflexus mossambicus]